METPIQVAVRLKPLLNVKDTICGHSISYANTVQLGNQHSFHVNYALPADCTQSYIFLTTICPLINSFLEGCDVSIVALGQANAGKTYTLLGPGLHCVYSETEHGIIPRFIRELFGRLSQQDRTTNISLTWTQICGENIQDLLGTDSVEVCDVSDAFHWLQLGISNKAPKNAHSLFTVTIQQQWIIDSIVEHRISTASFADLASCESVVVLDHLGKLRSIPNDNGLLSLYNVVNVLTDPYFNFENNYVPYNQSILTTLLKDSFGGRAKTLVICCVSPLLRDFSESLNCLQIAVKMQCTKNYVTTNSYTSANNILENNSENESTFSDVFGLQFAVSQWIKLVSNAENLFNKLRTTKHLSEQELDQIGEWLTLKQECEECLSSEETINLGNLEPQRYLGRIEEETELDHDSTAILSTPQNDLSESETESDLDPSRPDFVDKLNALMQTFRLDTDHLLSEQYENDLVHDFDVPKNNKHMNTNDDLHYKIIQKGRRKSIHPGDSLLPEILTVNQDVNFISSDHEKLDLRGIVLFKNESDPSKQLKTLTLNTDAKQKKIRQVTADLGGAQKQIDELQYTIQIKEQLIENMIKNGDTRTYAKQKFQKKRTKLQSEYYKARTQLAQAENTYLHCNKHEYKDEIDKHRSVAGYYEKRLRDIENIKIITDESARKIIELQNSLHTSRKQLERLKKQVRKEEKRKQVLQQELEEDKIKIKELESQQVDNEENRYTQELQQVLRETVIGFDEKDSLRHEIRNLRRTRDCLVEQRCQLDVKLKKEKMLSDVEERKLLECEEAIEAIDIAIEYKNELICGRKQLDNDRIEREEGEEMLMQRLMNLSENEMRTLLYKYFQKVIDLRDSSKKLETQLVQIEREYETSAWRVQTLSHLLQQVRLESERRIVILQQQHEEKLNLMMRHFADETSASSDPDTGKIDRVMSKILERNHQQICQIAGTSRQTDHPVSVKCKQVAKYSEENRDKNKLLAKFQELTRYHSEKRRMNTTIPQQNLKQLQSGSDTPATKVTRQKNKLIIQQSKIKK